MPKVNCSNYSTYGTYFGQVVYRRFFLSDPWRQEKRVCPLFQKIQQHVKRVFPRHKPVSSSNDLKRLQIVLNYSVHKNILEIKIYVYIFIDMYFSLTV